MGCLPSGRLHATQVLRALPRVPPHRVLYRFRFPPFDLIWLVMIEKHRSRLSRHDVRRGISLVRQLRAARPEDLKHGDGRI